MKRYILCLCTRQTPNWTKFASIKIFYNFNIRYRSNKSAGTLLPNRTITVWKASAECRDLRIVAIEILLVPFRCWKFPAQKRPGIKRSMAVNGDSAASWAIKKWNRFGTSGNIAGPAISAAGGSDCDSKDNPIISTRARTIPTWPAPPRARGYRRAPAGRRECGPRLLWNIDFLQLQRSLRGIETGKDGLDYCSKLRAEHSLLLRARICITGDRIPWRINLSFCFVFWVLPFISKFAVSSRIKTQPSSQFLQWVPLSTYRFYYRLSLALHTHLGKQRRLGGLFRHSRRSR